MRKSIDGRIFDTEKADIVGSASGGNGDFKWWDAGLYRTRKSKRFFLAGKGGPASQFRSTYYGGGCEIIPLDDAEAIAWAEKNLPLATVKSEFPMLSVKRRRRQ